MTVAELKRLTMAKLKKLILKNGAHKDRSNGLCVMEAAAWFAGEPHSDSPSCVDPGITSPLQYVNDNAPEDQRQELKSVVKEIIGTRTENVEVMHKRIFIATDFAVRFAAPLALEAAKLDKEAAALRALPPVDSRAAAGAASAAAWAASDAAGAAMWKKLMPEILKTVRTMAAVKA